MQLHEKIDPRILCGDDRQEHVLGADLFHAHGIVLKGKLFGILNHSFGIGRIIELSLTVIERTAEHLAVFVERHTRAAQNFIRLAVLHDEHGKNQMLRSDIICIVLLRRFGGKLHYLF